MYTPKAASSVLIVSSSEQATRYLTELLPPSLFSPVNAVGSAGEAQRFLVDRSADLVLINAPLRDGSGVALALDAAHDGRGVLLFVRAELYDQVSEKVEEYGVLTMARPCSRQAVFQSVKLLVATRARLRSYEEKALDLQTKMEEIRLVNRAKLLLMQHLQMTEPEAHRYIEKSAMDRCVKRTEVAKNVIRIYGS